MGHYGTAPAAPALPRALGAAAQAEDVAGRLWGWCWADLLNSVWAHRDSPCILIWMKHKPGSGYNQNLQFCLLLRVPRHTKTISLVLLFMDHGSTGSGQDPQFLGSPEDPSGSTFAPAQTWPVNHQPKRFSTQ